MMHDSTHLAALLILFVVRCLGNCMSYGVDYTNGGSFFLDNESLEVFSFTTAFYGRQFGKMGPFQNLTYFRMPGK